MNQGDLIEKVAASALISKAEAERAINAFKGAITDSLRKGHKVRLVGFGTFAVSHVPTSVTPGTYTAKLVFTAN